MTRQTLTRAPASRPPRPPRPPKRGRWRAAVVVIALCGGLVRGQATGTLEPTPPDLPALQAEVGEMSGMLVEVRDAKGPLQRRVRALVERIGGEELSLTGADVDAEALREARLALDGTRARIGVVAGRVDQYQVDTMRLAERREQMLQTLSRLPMDALRLRWEEALRLLDQQAELNLALADAFASVLVDLEREGDLLRDRLRLLQSRIEIGGIGDTAALAEDARVVMLQRVIGDFLRRAAELSTQVEGIADGPGAEDQRRALLAQRDDAVTRAFLRQNDLELILAQNRLEGLGALRDDDLMPVPVLRAARARLAEVGAVTEAVAADLAMQQDTLEAQRHLLRREALPDTERLAAIDALDALARFQQQDLEDLSGRLEIERQAYARLMADRSAAMLFEHHPLPANASDWRRVALNVADLPRRVASAVGALGRLTVQHLRSAPLPRLVLTLLASVGVVLLLPWLAGRLRPHRMDAATAALVRTLPRLVPAAVWAVAAVLLGLPREVWLPIAMVLLLWPTASLVMNLLRRTLADHDDGSERSAREQRRFRLALRLGLVPAVLVGALYILARTLSLAPILADLLDRFAMVGLLTLALPAFAARPLLAHSAANASGRARRRAGFTAWLSQILPVFLIATGLVGLAGYTDLAWVMLSYFGAAAVVLLALILTLGLLHDLQDHLDRGLSALNGPRESLWRTHFLEPGHRALQLAFVVIALWGLLSLWGWHSESPVMRWIGGVLGTELFRIGNAPFTPGDILIAALLVGAALWIGGWSQQVSYHLAYGRVRDDGLRRALATFTQYVVVVAGVLLALKLIGFDLTTLTVFAGALGVGIGFGLQNIVNNFVSGLLLLGERPLKIGDFVHIGDDEGYVSQIGIRSLTIRTEDQREVVIPNSSVIGEAFTNWTRSDNCLGQAHRIGIGCEDDVESAMRIIEEVLAAEPLVLGEPAPAVYLADYGEWSTVLELEYYIDISDGLVGPRVRSNLLLEIGRRFAEAGISMPYRRADIRLSLDQQSIQALAQPPVEAT